MFKPNSKLKSFQLCEDKTSVLQMGILLLAALFFIGLVLLGAWGVNRESEKSGKGNVSQKELSAADKELKLQEQVSDVIKTKDFSGCENINDATYKTVCINNIALNLAKETEDISYCQKIDGKLVPKEDCERQVVFTKSLEKEDINVCQETKIRELQKQFDGGFYNILSLKMNDVKVCSKVQEKEVADFCYNNFLVIKYFDVEGKNFDCVRLRGKEAQDDCQIVKTFSPEKESFQMKCSKLKTNLFFPYCVK